MNSSANWPAERKTPTAITYRTGHAGPRHEGERERDEAEPQRREQQGREVVEADVDDDEVDAPDHGDDGGDGDVTAGHADEDAEHDRQERLDFLDMTRKMA